MAHMLAGPVSVDAAPNAVAPLLRASRIDELEAEVASLRTELGSLRQEFQAFKDQF